MKVLRMTVNDFEKPYHTDFLGYLGEACSGLKSTPFIRRVNDLNSFRFPVLGIEESFTLTFREFVLTARTAQESDTIVPMDLTDDDRAVSLLTVVLACRLDGG